MTPLSQQLRDLIKRDGGRWVHNPEPGKPGVWVMPGQTVEWTPAGDHRIYFEVKDENGRLRDLYLKHFLEIVRADPSYPHRAAILGLPHEPWPDPLPSPTK